MKSRFLIEIRAPGNQLPDAREDNQSETAKKPSGDDCGADGYSSEEHDPEALKKAEIKEEDIQKIDQK